MVGRGSYNPHLHIIMTSGGISTEQECWYDLGYFKYKRYYGLEATRTYKKWSAFIQKGIKRIGRIVKGACQIVKRKNYREKYQEISGIDPMRCQYCQNVMELMSIWHPKYGTLFDIFSTLEEVKIEQEKVDRGGGHSVRPSSGGIQLSLFPLSL